MNSSSARATLATRRRVAAAGATDPGRQREVNEDRYHFDIERGIFIVVDGVGGHAAGGRAADVALARVRERLERETGAVADRIREAITIANNEIHRLASTRTEWQGMACVLTVAVVDDDEVTVGHVGDTRLYRLRGGRLEKVTRDHSPVGEREDAHELSELDAMRHPRRNEVYRDVGSEPHGYDDANFVDIQTVPFPADAALLMCSDGLTDLVSSDVIARVLQRLAGHPQEAAEALIDAANAAGGKDNVTVIYVEGERFAPAPLADDATRPQLTRRARRARAWSIAVRAATVALVAGVAGAAVWRSADWLPTLQSASIIAPAAVQTVQTVQPTDSIGAAIARAAPGSQVVVEPGEYREQLHLAQGVRVISRVPRAATLRLPASAGDGAAVVATNLSSGELVGFRIVGDAATPLGVGISITEAAVSIVDVEIWGAARAGVEFSGSRTATLLGSHLHDNSGAALVVHGAASPRVVNNTFSRNRFVDPSAPALTIAPGAAPLFRHNVFVGLSPDAATLLERHTGLPLTAENWFIPPAARIPAPTPVRRRPS
jgi:PPM family protein phosphatase